MKLITLHLNEILKDIEESKIVQALETDVESMKKIIEGTLPITAKQALALGKLTNTDPVEIMVVGLNDACVEQGLPINSYSPRFLEATKQGLAKAAKSKTVTKARGTGDAIPAQTPLHSKKHSGGSILF